MHILIINYLNAPAGSGKTHVLVHHAHELAKRGQKVLFAQPTKLLIEATIERELAPLNPRYHHRPIHSDTNPGAAITSIMHVFSDPSPGGQILFITHAALLTVPFFENSRDWVLIVDEVFDTESSHELNIPHTHAILTNHLVVVADGTDYGKLQAANGSKLQSIVHNRQADVVHQLFQPIAREISSSHWEVRTNLSQYDRLVGEQDGEGKLMTHGFLQPSILAGFDSILIASACFEETMLFQVWSRLGVDFQEAQALKQRLRYQQHQNGGLVNILYVTDEEWSKVLRVKHEAQIIAAVESYFGTQPFVYMTNKEGIPFTSPNAELLPNSPHGLNHFQSFHNAVVMSALNATPAHFKFMESKGLTAEALRTARYRTAVYQAVMRTSARNPNDQNAKDFVVMDRSTADWLSCAFPGSEISKLPGLSEEITKGLRGRKALHSNSAERQKAHRDRARAELLDELQQLNDCRFETSPYSILYESLPPLVGVSDEIPRNENTSISSNSVTSSYGSIFKSIFKREALGLVNCDNEMEFVAFLRDLHTRQVAIKQDGGLVSPAVFNPDLSNTTSRGLDNIEYIRGIWMDNDGGHLTPDAFAEIFPHLRMYIYNTHSHTVAFPRWRVFIPTSKAMTVEAHRLMMRQIERSMNDAGYWSASDLEKKCRIKNKRLHGFDESKFNAASLFYLPCQAKDPSDSFFFDFREAGRQALDVDLWVAHALENPRTPLSRYEGRRKNDKAEMPTDPIAPAAANEAVSRAITVWRSAGPGEGNRAFFVLGLCLRKAGMSFPDIESTLRSQTAARGGGEDKRLRQIPSILRSLQKREQRATFACSLADLAA